MTSVKAMADHMGISCIPRFRPLQILAFFGLTTLSVACRESGPLATVHTSRGPVRVRLELALTPEAQERGLMYRSALAEDHGMLFVFTEDRDHSFWMKNTLIPPDMLFIGVDGKVVGVHADATPLSTAPISGGRPPRSAREPRGATAARRGIAAGDRVEFEGVPGVGGRGAS